MKKLSTLQFCARRDTPCLVATPLPRDNTFLSCAATVMALRLAPISCGWVFTVVPVQSKNVLDVIPIKFINFFTPDVPGVRFTKNVTRDKNKL